ncbi:MAG: HAD family hydrolase [Alphaproteobacteria bacterium]|nr:HAD family hydrolase [Alphaproteobacteria bacterium]
MNTPVHTLPKLVLLDWDGTLVDSYRFLKAAHNHVRESFGFEPWDDRAFKDVLRLSTRDTYGRLYGEREEQATAILIRYVDANHADSLVPMDGAQELLETLHALGIPAGIVSNKRHERLAGDVAAMGWSRFVAACVGAGRAERDKPSADPILLAMSDVGYTGEPADVWYVGDTETDLQAAAAARATSVFVLHGMGDADLAERYRPSYVFENLKAFIRAIESTKIGASEEKRLARPGQGL